MNRHDMVITAGETGTDIRVHIRMMPAYRPAKANDSTDSEPSTVG